MDMSSIITSSPALLRAVYFPPCFFITHTDSYTSPQEGSYLIKFTDDIAPSSLLHVDESDHGRALFVSCCDINFLDLIVTKTKKITFDFRKSAAKPKTSKTSQAWSSKTLIY